MNTFDVEKFLLQCSKEFNNIYPISSELNIQQQRSKYYVFINIIPALILHHLSKSKKLIYKNKQIKNIEICILNMFIHKNPLFVLKGGHNWITFIFDDDKHDPFEWWKKGERSLLNIDLTGPALLNNAMINNIPFYTWGNKYGTDSTPDKFEYYIACYETSPAIHILKEILVQYVVDYLQYKGLGYNELTYNGFPLISQFSSYGNRPIKYTKYISGRRLIWIEYFHKCIQLAYNDEVNLNMLLNDLLPYLEKYEWPNVFTESKSWF
jgi:hypothetical protein